MFRQDCTCPVLLFVAHRFVLSCTGLSPAAAIRRTYTDDDFPDTVDVYPDGLGRRVTRHYVLQYEYTFFE